MVAPNRRSGRGSSGSALFSSFHVVLKPRVLSQKWPRKPWQRTFLEFSRGSVAAEAVAGVAAGALAAHFPRVFTWFCGRGSYRRSGRGSSASALFWSFQVVLWQSRREPWPRPEGPLVAPRPFGLPNAHSEKKLEHSLASCRKIDFLRFSLIFSAKLPRKPWKRTFLEFSRGSEVAGAIAEVAAEALAAHFSRVFIWFCGRGGSRRSGRGSRGNALS